MVESMERKEKCLKGKNDGFRIRIEKKKKEKNKEGIQTGCSVILTI